MTFSHVFFFCVVLVAVFYSAVKWNRSSMPEVDRKPTSRTPRASAQKSKSREKQTLPKPRPFYQDRYQDQDFANKERNSLDGFVIDDRMGVFDLMKLADLNHIPLQIPESWYPLTIELVKELDAQGWGRNVSCIKEKYASLHFYTDRAFEKIVEKYRLKSERVCAQCGAYGEVRSSGGWDVALCRKHYLESRGRLTSDENGFTDGDESYAWNEVTDVAWNKNYHDHYTGIDITFKTRIIADSYTKHRLFVPDSRIGFGHFLQAIPPSFKSLDYGYIRDHFGKASYCVVCGYEAVFDDTCECCDNMQKWVNSESFHKHLQMDWMADAGETYEARQQNYRKNPEFKLLFTQSEYEAFLEVDLSEDQDIWD